jgi:hypothetical protein
MSAAASIRIVFRITAAPVLSSVLAVKRRRRTFGSQTLLVHDSYGFEDEPHLN